MKRQSEAIGKRLTALMAGLLLVLLAACSTSQRGPAAPPSEPKRAAAEQPRIIIDRQALMLPKMTSAGRSPVRIGLLVPLTGPDATLGRALLDAAQLAVFESRRSDIMLLPRDTGTTADEAAKSAQAVLEAGAEIILGPLLSDQVNAVAPYGASVSAPVIAFSTTTSIARPGVYLLSFPAELEVERIIEHAVSSGYRRFAAMIPQGSYGNVVEQSLREAVTAHNATLVTVSRYPTSVAGMYQPVKDLANTGGFDAVLLPAGGTSLRGLAPLLPYSGIDPRQVKFLGTGLWDEQGLGHEPALVHGWFASPPPEARQKFIERFQAAYGAMPPRIASLAYDAVALVASLADAPEGQRFTPDRLTNASGFSGIDGVFRFRPDGHVERGLAVNEVQTNGVTVVSPAPQSFRAAGY